MIPTQAYATGFVTSQDGTQIGYRQFGAGPGLILVHGGMMYSQHFTKLATLLANEFTVYVPDRRGRGLSGPPGNYGLMAESQDLQALINTTSTQNVFGLSAGAIITLQTAIIEPALKKIALYEPPLQINGVDPITWADDFERALSKENYGKAFISIIKGTGDASLLSRLPAFITAPVFNLAIKAEKAKTVEKVLLKTLITAMRYDLKVIVDSQGIIEKCKSIAADVLLLNGRRSQPHFRTILNALKANLPRAKRIEFPGVGHMAAENDEKPELIANAIRSFLSPVA